MSSDWRSTNDPETRSYCELNPVWVTFDNEVHLCTWDESYPKGYRWRAINPMTSGSFREQGSLWQLLQEPNPPDTE